jgi:hypothetical protein
VNEQIQEEAPQLEIAIHLCWDPSQLAWFCSLEVPVGAPPIVLSLRPQSPLEALCTFLSMAFKEDHIFIKGQGLVARYHSSDN